MHWIYLTTFTDAKGWDFHQDLWNCFAHIQKCLKTFWKFMKTIWTLQKMLLTCSDRSPRKSFAKHSLFTFENWRVFRRRTVIYMRFLIHYCFECKLTFTCYIFSRNSWDMSVTTLFFPNKMGEIGPYVCECEIKGLDPWAWDSRARHESSQVWLDYGLCRSVMKDLTRVHVLFFWVRQFLSFCPSFLTHRSVLW